MKDAELILEGNATLKPYVVRFNRMMRRIYLKVPRTNLDLSKTYDSDSGSRYIRENKPKGVALIEITSESITHFFVTLHMRA